MSKKSLNNSINNVLSIYANRGALLISIAAFILLSVMRPFSLVNIITGIYVLNVVFDSFFAERFLSLTIKKYIDVYCNSFLILTIPILWFSLGGFAGAAPLWLIFATLYCIYGVPEKPRKYILCFFGIEILVITGLTVHRSEILLPITAHENIIFSFFSILSVGSYIVYITALQKKQLELDRNELIKMRAEAEQNYIDSLNNNDTLLETTRRLEMANHAQRSFSASMNHELRAPLNGIEGCLQILLLDDDFPADSRETVKNALTACKTINHTINDLLDFSKLEEGKFEIIKKPFDLRDIIDNITTIFKPQASAKNLNFTIQLPSDTRVSIVADEMKIQQIFTNLISNAIKYTKEGSVSVTISTQRGNLHFSVSDTGQGMSEDSIKVLFNPFTRFNLENNTHIQGTGLGMNIVHNMLQAMNGQINVSSKLGEGTTMDVDIPIMFYDSDITFQSPRIDKKVDFADSDLSKYRVLCVDDTELNRTIFKGLLKNTGAKVTTVDCGTRALKLCEKVDFDIVFLDHLMPEMDGIELLDRLRALPNNKYVKTPIIMITGNAGSEYKELFENHGADGCLIKPVIYQDLIDSFRFIKKEA